MKKKFFYFILSALFFSMIVACKKKSDDPTPNNSVTLNATDGNVYFEGNNTTNQKAVKGQLTTETLIISGTDFELEIDTIGGIVGTYNITPGKYNNYIQLTNSTDTWVSYNNTGQITITAIDRINQTISGYFSSTMTSSSGSTTFTGDFKNVFYTAKSSMTALVNGSNWLALNPYYSVINMQLNINGSNGFGGAPIYLNLNGVTQTGTYDLTLSGSYRAEYYTTNFIQYKATSGQVIITEYDTVKKIIKGTFNFVAPQIAGTGIGGTGPSTITVTNGQFNIQTP